MHRLQEFVRLHRMKTGAREVARLLGMSPNTERDYRRKLERAGLLDGTVDALPELDVLSAAVRASPVAPAAHEVSSVARWRDHVEALMKKDLGPRAIHDRLRLEEAEFQGSYSAIKRLWRALRRERGVQPEDVAIPVDTAPGQVAQVDFGYVGRMWDPVTQTLRRTWCFVMVLGYSRHMVARLVFDQRTETWLALHVQAWTELGGVVDTVVPDNLKAAVVRAAFGVDKTQELNRSYREQARHYGHKIDPAPPRAPRKKGKVESAVKYVKNNALKGFEGRPIDEVQRHLSRWVREIAGTRCHGTTRAKPLEVFENEEAAALLPLPAVPYSLVMWKKAKVHPDVHIAFDKRLYSAPWRLMGQEVWVRATASTVAIYTGDDALVALHDRRGPSYRSTIEEHLPEFRRDLRHRSQRYWEERAAALAPEVGAYIHEVFEADDVLSQLRTVQAMVTHLALFPPHRARAACVRAQHFGSHTYRALKNILRQGLDLEPLPAAVSTPALAKPRYARNISDLLPFDREVSDEPN